MALQSSSTVHFISIDCEPELHRPRSDSVQETVSELESAPSQQRVSFYVQAFDDMFSVVSKEAFLFDQRELLALNRLSDLDYEAKYLFIRLYLRKHKFIRLGQIDYEKDITDLEAACQSLWDFTELASDAADADLTSVDPSGMVAANVVDIITPRPAVSAPASGPSTTKSAKVEMLDLTMSEDEQEDNENASLAIVNASANEIEEQALAVIQEERMDFTRIADSQGVLQTLATDSLLDLLTVEELMKLGKTMRVSTKRNNTRREWTLDLLNCTNQSTLSFDKKGKDMQAAVITLGFDRQGVKLSQSNLVAAHALKVIGSVIRLHSSYVTLVDRLSLIYHRTTYTSSTSSTTSLTASLLSRFGKRNFPDFQVTRTAVIFTSRELLREYERALALERKMEELLGETQPVSPSASQHRTSTRIDTAAKIKNEKLLERERNWKQAVNLFESIWERWQTMCKEGAGELLEEKGRTSDIHERLLYYRKRFHPGWPMTRIVYKSASVFARLHDRPKEIEILRALLKQYSFRRGKRGAWYDRLALLLMNYASPEEEEEKCGPKKKSRLATARNIEAIELCRKALRDPYCHLIYQSSLQRRIARLESTLQVPKSERQVFDELLLKAETRVMEGTRLDDATIGLKSVWSASDGAELSVEELALEQYRKEGWNGFHSENGILTTIFTLCMWSVIFAPIDGVFETPYQSSPLDLQTDSFSILRSKLIRARLSEIEKGRASDLISLADDRERPRQTWVIGVRWDDYSKKELLEIVECLGGHAVATICRMFSEEFEHRTGGIPDLCLWKPDESEIMFVEVKGPGDKLSETQKVWIDVLLSSGTKVEVCRVLTSEEKDRIEGKKGAAAEKAKNGKGKRGRVDG